MILSITGDPNLGLIREELPKDDRYRQLRKQGRASGDGWEGIEDI